MTSSNGTSSNKPSAQNGSDEFVELPRLLPALTDGEKAVSRIVDEVNLF